MKSLISYNLCAKTAIGVIRINEPLDSDPSLDFAAYITLSGIGLLGSHLKKECLMVPPISNGFDCIHFPYYRTTSFRSSFEDCPFINPFNRLRVSSPSSVIWPGATLCGPPPGIDIDFVTDT